MESNEDYLIQEFIKSNDFQQNEYISYKQIDFERSSVKYLNGEEDKPVINIIFADAGKIIGSVEAIKNKSEKILLPNNGKYFMFYRDYTTFDFINMSGSIKLFDLNYDNHFFGYGEIGTGLLSASFYNPMPSNILNKYEKVISTNKTILSSRNQKTPDIKTESILCDGNDDGNVSFSECYKCFNNACGSSETCVIMCFLVGDVIGGIVSPVNIPWCQTSIAAESFPQLVAFKTKLFKLILMSC
jgi:hypothetical protein